MKWLNLQLIKAQLRMEQDFTEEDELLTLYGESAEQTILDQTRRTEEELVEMGGGESVPPTIKQASLMLVDVSYQYRSPVSAQNMSIVPYTPTPHTKCLPIISRLTQHSRWQLTLQRAETIQS